MQNLPASSRIQEQGSIRLTKLNGAICLQKELCRARLLIFHFL